MLTALASTRSGFSRPVMLALIGQTAEMCSKTPEILFEVVQLGLRHAHVDQIDSRHIDLDRHQLPRLLIGQRPQQDSVHHRKQRRVGADP